MGRTSPSELCLLLKTLLVSTHTQRETIASARTAVLEQTTNATEDGEKKEALSNTVVRLGHGTATADKSVELPRELWCWLGWQRCPPPSVLT